MALFSYYFEQRDLPCLEHEGFDPVDFESDYPVQAVRKNELLCEVSSDTGVEDASDGTGSVIPSGENTHISADGKQLFADIDGIVYLKDGLICVKHHNVIPEDLEGPNSDLEYTGDLHIKGNVFGSLKISATGNVVVDGMVQGAVITSGGTIRVCQGATGKAVLKAAGQVQCKLLEDVTVDAGGSCYTEVALNSRIKSGASVYINNGRGYLIGGEVQAGNFISAKRVGNSVGTPTKLVIHGSVEQDEKSDENIQESKMTKQEQLILKRQKLMHQTCVVRTAQILCEEIFPNTDIRIGDLHTVITALEKNCKVHTYFDNILLK